MSKYINASSNQIQTVVDLCLTENNEAYGKLASRCQNISLVVLIEHYYMIYRMHFNISTEQIIRYYYIQHIQSIWNLLIIS